MARETIEAEIWGVTFRKTTTAGKRFLAVAQAPEWDKPDVASFSTAERAAAWGFSMRDRHGCEAHAWAPATVVT